MVIDIYETECIIWRMSKRIQQASELEQAIIKAIEDSGMNQPELAASSGVDQGTISRFLEKDPDKRRSVTLPIADKLCKALGLKLIRGHKRKRGKKHA